ncbi:hypothetical protein BDN71DRAFT_1429304 [Pleurotus eryngii]|uniref:Uncharacterized protein n=1 Tax=Pleurotus eryngii TaxID=5323 RepID=A0A9P6A2M0_PLEER|nr:hypothetical protein BDN71DRAFT_1429304 [Pleurotus eryngii]
MDSLELDGICKAPPPPFGYPMLKYFGSDPKYVNLNNVAPEVFTVSVVGSTHGASVSSFGSVLTPVRAECVKVAREVERNPDLFLRFTHYDTQAQVRELIAPLIGAQADEFSTTHEGVSRAVQYLADTPPYPSVCALTITYPITHADIISTFRAHVKSVVALKSPGKKVVTLIDSIVSNPEVLPAPAGAREECLIIKEPVSHQIEHPDTPRYISLSFGVKYDPERLHGKLATGNGTAGFIPFYGVVHALRFRAWLGGEEKINEYCHRLAIDGGKRLAEVLGTPVMDPDGSLTLYMGTIWSSLLASEPRASQKVHLTGGYTSNGLSGAL